MTVETKCFILLGDIFGIHVECKRCHLKLTIGIEEAARQRIRLCPGCNELWMEEDSAQQRAFVKLAAALSDAGRAIAESKFSLGLEVPYPPR